MLQELSRNIRIEAADNGYVLVYEGRTELDEFVRAVEIYSNIEDLCAALVDLDAVDLSDY